MFTAFYGNPQAANAYNHHPNRNPGSIPGEGKILHISVYMKLLQYFITQSNDCKNSNGKTSLKLDETALRQALAENPESVKDAFVSSTENGGATDGLMAQMKQVVDRYAGTSGATKGILIEKAGSKYSPTAALNNTMLDKMNDIDKSIQKWQDKLSDRVDYYTNKFTQMEVLLQQMNSQSSALAGLMGG